MTERLTPETFLALCDAAVAALRARPQRSAPWALLLADFLRQLDLEAARHDAALRKGAASSRRVVDGFAEPGEPGGRHMNALARLVRGRTMAGGAGGDAP